MLLNETMVKRFTRSALGMRIQANVVKEEPTRHLDVSRGTDLGLIDRSNLQTNVNPMLICRYFP